MCGDHYTSEQRERIVTEVTSLRQTGVQVKDALPRLGVAKSTFYGWGSSSRDARVAVTALLPSEREAILRAKQKEPQLRHRAISGILRHEEVWVSSSSCYRVLSAADLVEPYARREAPKEEPQYEPVGPNLLWGEDWTKLLIAGRRWYLLVLLDLFSRLIVAWDVVPTVTGKQVKELVAHGMLAQGLDRPQKGMFHKAVRPRLRADRGSPNVAGSVQEFLDEIGVDLSLSRVRRPTDNARVERVNGTLKQEEIYCQGPSGYLSPEGARASLGRYIDYYCQRRPHQALWNFTPAHVHTVGNKTKLREEYREKVEQAKQKRLRHNRAETGVRPSTFWANSV
jgi:putative transposase